ncbi:metal ABC transporter solute-binding protein, Zn/Mn family [Reichenbachiella agariperforans]|uniref:Manganese/zinc/iron transport system substrate-binding protein n=1 Tax=Reichenbachiella agariperforans TaxID=156994 RepID=A0A1M6J579_REIAG|nr:zinc ABC transporter substrate-binding protein [Reichenbachiella agariperforans]MBU2913067.1 zinc ABC transporter substrate-binding protein [Reichenbachiella agariperforans]SHJ41860.1 manganese/zinc/iron transport system substrate-binding protein [Reichenbachiella agariperforans]
MNKHLYHITLILSLFCILSCTPKQKEKKGKVQIVTTTGMIYDAVIHIGGDQVEAQALMGPGVDPHLYKATQGDLQKLQQADIVFYNGLHLEGKMGEVFEKLARIKNVAAISADLSDSLLRESETYPGTYDPHIWFDVALWADAIQSIRDQLIRYDSAHIDYYTQNANNYLQQLDSLDTAVKSEIATIPPSQRLLITAHDAFGYFGDAYDIEVKGLQGLSTLSEPGLKDISQLVKLIIDRKIKAVFIETSVSKKAINAVVQGCKESGHDVKIGGSLYSDAMGSFGEFEGTYIGMVHTNVQTIVNALK